MRRCVTPKQSDKKMVFPPLLSSWFVAVAQTELCDINNTSFVRTRHHPKSPTDPHHVDSRSPCKGRSPSTPLAPLHQDRDFGALTRHTRSRCLGRINLWWLCWRIWWPNWRRWSCHLHSMLPLVESYISSHTHTSQAIWSFIVYGGAAAIEIWAPHFFYRIGALVGYILHIIFWLSAWAWSASAASFWLSYTYGFGFYDSAWKREGQALGACAGLGALIW